MPTFNNAKDIPFRTIKRTDREVRVNQVQDDDGEWHDFPEVHELPDGTVVAGEGE